MHKYVGIWLKTLIQDSIRKIEENKVPSEFSYLASFTKYKHRKILVCSAYRIFPIRAPRPNSAPVLIEPRVKSMKRKLEARSK